jgi:hypothetical protein
MQSRVTGVVLWLLVSHVIHAGRRLLTACFFSQDYRLHVVIHTTVDIDIPGMLLPLSERENGLCFTYEVALRPLTIGFALTYGNT